MSEQPTIPTERLDDVPLLLAHMQRLELPSILDAHFPPHGNRQGLSLGRLVTVWLSHILSRADHRLNRVRPWAAQLQLTLNLPIIARVRTSLARSGLLYVDDSKLGALSTRAHLQAVGDHYRCPLGRVQLDTVQLAGLVEAALAASALTLIHRPTADGLLLVEHDGRPVVSAEAWETSAELTAEVGGAPLSWSDA